MRVSSIYDDELPTVSPIWLLPEPVGKQPITNFLPVLKHFSILESASSCCFRGLEFSGKKSTSLFLISEVFKTSHYINIYNFTQARTWRKTIVLLVSSSIVSTVAFFTIVRRVFSQRYLTNI